MSVAVTVAIILVGLGLSALFSGSEIGLYRANRLRLHLSVQRGDRAAARLAGLLEDEQGAPATLLIGNNIVNYLTTTAVAYLFSEILRLAEFDAQAYTVLLVTPVIFVFGEVLPKTFFHRQANEWMGRVVWVLAVAGFVLRHTGTIWALKQFTAKVSRWMGVPADSRRFAAPKRRVAMLLQEALAGGQHGEWQSDVITRVIDLSERAVRSIMVPAGRTTVIPATAGRSELIRIARETGHARLPVVSAPGGGNSRRPWSNSNSPSPSLRKAVGPPSGQTRLRLSYVVGMVKIDDLLRRDDWMTVGECMEPPLTLSPGDSAIAAITRLRHEHREAAIVTAASGRMLGLITLRDLLQEVVGEAADAAALPK